MGKESPCKRECIYDSRLGFCTSCGRTIEEISGWMKFSAAYREEIYRRAEERLRKEQDGD